MKKITRRSFLKATVLSAAALGLSACGASASSAPAASAAEGAFKVGIINYVDDASLNQIIESLRARLDEIAGEREVAFDHQNYYDNAQADRSTLNQIAANMVANQVDVVVAVATPTALVMQSYLDENDRTDIPVVFAAVSDPDGAGLTGLPNVTGTSDALNTDAIFDLMFAVDPTVQKVGLLYDLGQDSSTQAIADAKAYLDKRKVAYVEKNGTTTAEVLMAADALVAEGVDAVFTPTDNTIMTAELAIYETFANAGVPHYAGADSFALNGAFCGYGVDYVQLGRATADIVAQVLCDGTSPADIPCQTFDNGIATVNTEICDALALELAQVKAVMEPYCTQIKELVTAESF